MKNQNNNFGRNFVWNTIGTTANALTSLVYMIIVTRLNGLSDAGVFSFCFSNAGVLVVIGMYMGRTYQVSDQERSDKAFFYTRFITCGLMLAIALIMAQIYGYTSENMFIYMVWIFFKLLDAFVDMLYGVLQKNDQLYCVGISLTAKSTLGIIIFLSANILTRNILIASIGAVAANLIVVLVYDIPHYRKYTNQEKLKKDEIAYLLKDGFFIFGTTLLSNYLINASKYAINANGTNEEQAVFGIVFMPATVMILAGQYLIHPYLVKLTYLFNANRYKDLVNIVKRISLMLLGIGGLGIIAASLLGIPILETLYGAELAKYKPDLIIVICGAICYSIVTILQNVLTVMHRNRIQLVVFMVSSVIAYILAKQFVLDLGVKGATIAYLISMFIIIVFFAGIMYKEIRSVSEKGSQ